ncbi:GNAT family N-acetyltransferase [Geodermatophilus sp. DF01_2]|uniref:GNAT family N-acetyltransferase n=1 Tax=Geodermatophilus sp. DF01-2 TaxID=2559610 RepID=UPI001FD74256|nr:GNAT family N-acetyltransferase [Geodermatophilus sp. DF01_2]
MLTAPVDAGTVETTTAEVAATAGWPHRAAALLWPGAAPVAAALAARGWEAVELLVVARPAERLPGGERAEVVGQSELHSFWDRSWRRDLAPHPDLDTVVAQLIGREHRNDEVVAVTDVGVREGGRVVAAGQLRVDGATAADESVVTEPGFRGRGHADAVLARLLTLAADAGCDRVVLQADAADWPRQWYARRGFVAVGSTWDVVRPARVQAGATTESNR